MVAVLAVIWKRGLTRHLPLIHTLLVRLVALVQVVVDSQGRGRLELLLLRSSTHEIRNC
jgi:hypothetical protein